MKSNQSFEGPINNNINSWELVHKDERGSGTSESRNWRFLSDKPLSGKTKETRIVIYQQMSSEQLGILPETKTNGSSFVRQGSQGHHWR